MLELGHSEFLQLLLPLHGLSEPGDYRAETITVHCLSIAQLSLTPGDLSLFYRRLGRDLCALSGNYVDHLLRAAPCSFRAAMESSLRSQFECKPSLNLPADFIGYRIGKKDDGILHAHMENYIDRLTSLAKDVTFKQYSGLRASILWLSHARLHTAAFASLVGSNAIVDFCPAHISEINAQLDIFKKSRKLKLTFPQLDLKTLRLVVYADGSLANRKDKGSQIGYVICLTDGCKWKNVFTAI